MIKIVGNSWTSPIKYAIDKKLNIKKIKSAIKHIEEKTCLKFSEVQNLGDTDEGIKFVKKDQCSSSLGKQDNKVNIINLTYECSEIFGVVQHEIGDKKLNIKKIKSAIKHIEEKTCLKFSEVQNLDDTDEGIKFVKKDQCSSSLGKQDNKVNIINLTSECSGISGVVQHEIGHALGLIHKHQRDDRDSYVSIWEANIMNGYSDQFDDYGSNVLFNSLNITYEYGSAMHYERIAYST
uniref:Metalloendopeptidase n=1 Tax=Parastrongyloides trichosuri TaxID=131310 RepID=A0A0N4Z8Y3_PARTI